MTPPSHLLFIFPRKYLEREFFLYLKIFSTLGNYLGYSRNLWLLTSQHSTLWDLNLVQFKDGTWQVWFLHAEVSPSVAYVKRSEIWAIELWMCKHELTFWSCSILTSANVSTYHLIEDPSLPFNVLSRSCFHLMRWLGETNTKRILF